MSIDPSTPPSVRAPGQVRVDPQTADERLREVEEELDRSVSLLEATLESTTDGILVVDREGLIVRHNHRFLEIWGLTAESVSRGEDDAVLSKVVRLLEDPHDFMDRVRALYADPTRSGYDLLRLKDGRRIERYSRPQRLGDQIVGRVWTFRDVTQQKRVQEALLASERRYRRLFEESRHALYITTHNGDFVDVNDAMLELFGYSRERLLRLNAADLYANREDRDRFQREMEERGSVRNYEVQLEARDGRILDCLITATARRQPTDSVTGYEGIIEDITERKQSTEALRLSEQYFRSLIENALDTITIVDADGTIRFESSSVQRMLGLTPAEMLGKSIFEFVHPEDRQHAQDVFGEVVQEPGSTKAIEVRFVDGDGCWRTLEAVGKNLLQDPVVGGIVINARDVTQRREAEERLLHDAFHDRLTGLPNRALFMDRLGQLVKRGQRGDTPGFTILFLDVDRFKVVNDSLGHTIGDQLLVEIGRRLETCLRPGDTVARVGGDEFALLLDATAAAGEAETIADRIHHAMEQPFAIARREVYATVSIGIAVSTDGYTRPEDILRDADIAMYRSKKTGRSRSQVFDRGMHEHAVAVLELETDLRRALEKQEFVLHFQPIVSLRDGRLLGFESLLRWHHPERGILQPAEFLDVAEETGLIVPIGWWTVQQAARRAKEWWDQESRGPYVAVNLSATQFSQPDLIEQVRGALGESGASPEALRLELTENVIMDRAEETAQTMARLRELGISLMIDDFGTGYSSLSYLHRFAAHTLKIDGSFISEIGPNGENSEIVRTIVALADELGMEAVAEGVETPEQFRMVRILGCRSAQGYHLARPMPDHDAQRIVREVWDLA